LVEEYNLEFTLVCGQGVVAELLLKVAERTNLERIQHVWATDESIEN